MQMPFANSCESNIQEWGRGKFKVSSQLQFSIKWEHSLWDFVHFENLRKITFQKTFENKLLSVVLNLWQHKYCVPTSKLRDRQNIFNTIHIFRSRKRRGSETLSEEEERSSGDESGAGGRHRRGRRSGQRLRKESRRRGEETGDKLGKLIGINMRRSGSPVIMTECTAAMVLMDLSCSPANRGRMSHASGHSGRTQLLMS